MEENLKFKINRVWRRKSGKRKELKVKVTFLAKLKYNQCLAEVENHDYKIALRLFSYERKSFNAKDGFRIKYIDEETALIETVFVTKIKQEKYDAGEITNVSFNYTLENSFLNIKTTLKPKDLKSLMGKMNINSIHHFRSPGLKSAKPYVGRKGQYISVYQGGGCSGR